MEGEEAPSDEQTEDPTRQSGSGGVEFGLEIDGGGVDAAVAVDRGDDGGVALVGCQCRILDIEELGADFQSAIVGLTTMHPYGCAIGNLFGSSKMSISHGEAQLDNDIPQFSIVGDRKNDLVATDGDARGARHGVDGLDAVEEGELVALGEGVVVVDNGL